MLSGVAEGTLLTFILADRKALVGGLTSRVEDKYRERESGLN